MLESLSVCVADMGRLLPVCLLLLCLKGMQAQGKTYLLYVIFKSEYRILIYSISDFCIFCKCQGCEWLWWVWSLLISKYEESDYYDRIYMHMYFATKLDIQIGRVEVVIFNCPEWGISVESIEIYVDKKYIIFPETTSCRSLVRLCTV